MTISADDPLTPIPLVVLTALTGVQLLTGLACIRPAYIEEQLPS